MEVFRYYDEYPNSVMGMFDRFIAATSVKWVHVATYANSHISIYGGSYSSTRRYVEPYILYSTTSA
jgi:hypothetical protein